MKPTKHTLTNNENKPTERGNIVIVSDGLATALLLNDMWLTGIEHFTYEADGTDIVITINSQSINRLCRGGRKEFYETASKMLGYKVGEK